MIRNARYVFFILSVCFGVQSPVSAEGPGLTGREKNEIIKTTLRLLNEEYVFPERIPAVESLLQSNMRRGAYDSAASPEQFLLALNRDLESASNDRHVNVSFDPVRVKQIIAEQRQSEDHAPESMTPEWLQRMQFENFRLRSVERLEGNIGYFRFLNFPPLSPSRKSLIAAMNFLSYSSALVIDLRENGGGSAETMQFLLSYFLDDSVQLSELRFRKEHRIEKRYTIRDSMINKFPASVPVYILVGPQTSSAAEGFAYTLQQFQRGTVIGERTKGEGNPGSLFAVNDVLYIMIPTAVGINAVSKKSIDGIGVIPDIVITPKQAYAKALLKAYDTLSLLAPSKQMAAWYRWQKIPLENELNPAPLTAEIIASVVGEYAQGRKIVAELSQILYINMRGEKERFDYLGNGLFQSSKKSWLRLSVPFTDKPVPYFEWLWDDGTPPEKILRVGN